MPSPADAPATSQQKPVQQPSSQQPSRSEQFFLNLQNKVIHPVFAPTGWSVKLGGLPTGGGFSAGPRYTRSSLFNNKVTSDTSIVGSTRLWWRGETSLSMPSLVLGHLSFRLDAAYEDAASVDYYGEGPTSSPKGRSNFRREFTTMHFETGVHTFNNRLTFGYRIGGLLVNVGKGRRDDPPSATLLYNESNTPGLDKQSDFITGSSFANLDLTHKGSYNPAGFQFQVENTQFWDKSRGAYSFDLLSMQGEYDRPFADGKRTFTLHARNQTAFTGNSQQAPFYLQPTLGGSDDLRGYHRYRYYDNGSSVANAEYRWSLARLLEMGVFVDAGNVYDRPGLIGLRHTHADGGVGFRFKNADTTYLRIDVGASPEGAQIWFVFNPAFAKLPRSF